MAISKELKEELDKYLEQVKAKKIKPMECLKKISALLSNYKGTFAIYPTLHIASAEGLIEVVKLLFKSQKYDFNWQGGRDNKTALMLASQEGHLEIVNLLLTRPGINPNLTDTHGFTALDFAQKAGHTKIAEVLISHGATAGKENVSENAKIQQEAFNRMQASNRAVLAGKQPDAYANIRAGQMTREEAEARLRQLEAECEQIKSHHSNQRQKYLEELQTDLSNAFARQAPSYAT